MKSLLFTISVLINMIFVAIASFVSGIVLTIIAFDKKKNTKRRKTNEKADKEIFEEIK